MTELKPQSGADASWQREDRGSIGHFGHDCMYSRYKHCSEERVLVQFSRRANAKHTVLALLLCVVVYELGALNGKRVSFARDDDASLKLEHALSLLLLLLPSLLSLPCSLPSHSHHTLFNHTHPRRSLSQKALPPLPCTHLLFSCQRLPHSVLSLSPLLVFIPLSRNHSRKPSRLVLCTPHRTPLQRPHTLYPTLLHASPPLPSLNSRTHEPSHLNHEVFAVHHRARRSLLLRVCCSEHQAQDDQQGSSCFASGELPT